MSHSIDRFRVSVHSTAFDYREDLADVRVLMENCIREDKTPCTFIIVTKENLAAEKEHIMQMFDKMNGKLPSDCGGLFELKIWDDSGLLEVEKALGLKIDI